MLVQLADTWLTNDGTGATMERAWTTTQEMSLDGEEILQEVEVVRSLAQAIFDRGNMVHALGFRVTRNFAALYPDAGNPIALASAFAMTHFSGLPKSGPLVLTCGGWGEAPIQAIVTPAFLKSSKSTTRGVQVVTSYSLRFASIAEYIPTSVLGVGDGTILGTGVGGRELGTGV